VVVTIKSQRTRKRKTATNTRTLKVIPTTANRRRKKDLEVFDDTGAVEWGSAMGGGSEFIGVDNILFASFTFCE